MRALARDEVRLFLAIEPIYLRAPAARDTRESLGRDYRHLAHQMILLDMQYYVPSAGADGGEPVGSEAAGAQSLTDFAPLFWELAVQL
jgi:hypothetical protein